MIQEHCIKKTPVVETSRRSTFIYRHCTCGPCPFSYILHRRYTWALPLQLYSQYSPHVGTAPGNAARRTGRMQSVPGYKPLWQLSRWKSCRDAGSAQACSLSCTWLPRRKLSQAFPSVSSSGQSFLGRASLVSNCMTSGLQLISHWAL